MLRVGGAEKDCVCVWVWAPAACANRHIATALIPIKGTRFCTASSSPARRPGLISGLRHAFAQEYGALTAA
jgi:hypothetical protein